MAFLVGLFWLFLLLIWMKEIAGRVFAGVGETTNIKRSNVYLAVLFWKTFLYISLLLLIVFVVTDEPLQFFIGCCAAMLIFAHFAVASL
jgi:hypothetical protein